MVSDNLRLGSNSSIWYRSRSVHVLSNQVINTGKLGSVETVFSIHSGEDAIGTGRLLLLLFSLPGL